ncbi:MAG: radical SAM protein [Deltaproteobacteria bacterium]|nr:radical SAM protein [Deltaproteobacteria bacterium]
MHDLRTPSVVLVAVDSPWKDTGGTFYPFSYGVETLRASLRSDPSLADVGVALVDLEATQAEAFFDAVMAHRPTLVALSTYIWSLPVYRGLVSQIRRHDPSIQIVAGGPAARRSVFDLAPWQGLRDNLDAVVPGEGEGVIRELARHHREPNWKAGIAGLEWWTGSDWHRNLPAPRPDIDAYPSPYELGLSPRGMTGYIETFRGCPIHCAFCQWGEQNADRVHSVDYLVRHLEGLCDAEVYNVYFLDAAFNLQNRAFRNVVEAERQVGLLKDKTVFGHLYPTYLQESHLEFFDSIGRVHAAVGIQSFDEEVLKRMGRPFDMRKFHRTLGMMKGRLKVEFELIFGLPGDNPDSFLRTLDTAIEYGDAIKVFQCLALPDALLERADAMQIEFDPETFSVESAMGWTRADWERTYEKVLRRTEEFEERVQHFDWLGFVCNPDGNASPDRQQHIRPIPIPALEIDGLPGAVDAVAKGWSFDGARQDGTRVLFDLHGPKGTVELQVERQTPESRFFHARDGLVYSYRGKVGQTEAPDLLRVIETLHDHARGIVLAEVST